MSEWKNPITSNFRDCIISVFEQLLGIVYPKVFQIFDGGALVYLFEYAAVISGLM